MKKIFGALAGAMFVGNAVAADITVYHMPTCPHCHHARDYISQNLVYEYPTLKVTTVDVTQDVNRGAFIDALKKCKYESGGVPVMVIGEKCFQGFSEAMGDEIRNAIEADLDDAAKKTAAENKKALAADAEGFRKAHTDRENVEVEFVAQAQEPAQVEPQDAQANSAPTPNKNDSWVFYVILGVLVAGLGFVLTRKGKK
ncbi:MAG: glutaredoxin family protein [Alphaproteobacteria bacterium]|nr:glutaredoxin family protein [Alphaproteobacteria bacterium]